VTLIVSWGEGKEDEQLVITTHLVRVPRASGAAGAAGAMSNLQKAPAGAPVDLSRTRTMAPGGPQRRMPQFQPQGGPGQLTPVPGKYK